MQFRHKLSYLALIGLLAVLAWQILPQLTVAEKSKESGMNSELIKRGEYLVTIMDCDTCHTPKVQGPDGMSQLDMARRFSGHPADGPYPTWTPTDLQQRNAIALANPMLTAWAGPWGVNFAANITPDKETGLGEWTSESFIAAIRTGKHQGQPNGRDILPPMPWQAYKSLTDEDSKAIWAFLRNVAPVKNQVPTPMPPVEMPPAK